MLTNIKVLELASVLAGPSVGQFFAECGADVIKVENIRTRGDVTRTWKVSNEMTDDRSSYFCAVNWGKKSIGVDLNLKEGREIVCKLAEKSDIVIASYKPGDAERLGVDFKSLSSENPKLIYGQITGFGPGSSRVGYDAVIQAEAGFMFMNGEPGGNSLKMPVALVDILAAHHLKEAILLSLLKRYQTNEGSFVEVSLLDAAVASLANQASNWLVAGVVPQKQGSSHPNIAPYGDIFKTADGVEILLAVGTDSQFGSLCKILELADADSTNFRTNALRVNNRTVLRDLLQEKIRLIAADDIVPKLLRASIPYGIVKNLKEVFGQETKHMLLHSTDRIGVKTFAASLFHLKQSHFLPPPHFGEHTRQILSQSIQMPPDAIEALIREGVVG